MGSDITWAFCSLIRLLRVHAQKDPSTFKGVDFLRVPCPLFYLCLLWEGLGSRGWPFSMWVLEMQGFPVWCAGGFRARGWHRE